VTEDGRSGRGDSRTDAPSTGLGAALPALPTVARSVAVSRSLDGASGRRLAALPAVGVLTELPALVGLFAGHPPPFEFLTLRPVGDVGHAGRGPGGDESRGESAAPVSEAERATPARAASVRRVVERHQPVLVSTRRVELAGENGTRRVGERDPSVRLVAVTDPESPVTSPTITVASDAGTESRPRAPNVGRPPRLTPRHREITLVTERSNASAPTVEGRRVAVAVDPESTASAADPTSGRATSGPTGVDRPFGARRPGPRGPRGDSGRLTVVSASGNRSGDGRAASRSRLGQDSPQTERTTMNVHDIQTSDATVSNSGTPAQTNDGRSDGPVADDRSAARRRPPASASTNATGSPLAVASDTEVSRFADRLYPELQRKMRVERQRRGI
jgi:hypothetical protein